MAALVTMPTTTGMVQSSTTTSDNNNGSSSVVVEESHIRDEEMQDDQHSAGSRGSPSAGLVPAGPENNNPTSLSPSVLVNSGNTRQRRVVHRRRRQRHLAMSPPTDEDDDDMEAEEEEEDEEPEAADDDLRPSGRQQQVGSGGAQQQAEQLYSLRWHDFQSSILSSFRHLRDVEDFVDVTLACDGKSFTAHKMVLSACSPYFRHLLKANPCQHPIVILRDVKYRDMEALLRFMYNGEVSVSNEQLPSVLHTARTLQVKGLADVPENNNSSSNNNNSTGLNHNSKRVLDYSPNQTPSSRDSSAERPVASAVTAPHPPSRKRARSGSKSPIGLAQHPEEMMGLLKETRRRRSSNDDDEEDDEDEEDEDDEVLKERMRLLDAHRESLLSQALEGRSSQSLMAHLLATRRQSGNQSEASSITGHQSRMNLHRPQRRSSSQHQDDEASDTDDTDASDRDRTDVGDLSNTEDNVYPSSGLMGDLHHHQRSGGHHQLHGEMQPPSSGGYGGSSAQHHPLLNLQGLQSLFPGGGNSNGPSGGRDGGNGGHHGLTNSSSGSDLTQATRRSLDLMRIRATDPRPCPQCGKIYRSAHTLRTHLEDKHTVCPGYRCVLCGTVAKSRNSLHSHMSRQHRGISTKDLPVVPMPAPFDPVLASCLLAKAGVKVSPAELAARASPTSGNPRGRTADLRLDFKSPHSSGGSLPPGTLPPQIMYNINQKVTIGGLQSHRNNPLQLIPLDQDAEDLSLAQQRLRSESRDHQAHHHREHQREHHRERHREHSGSRTEKGSSGGGGPAGGIAGAIPPYGPAAAAGLVNRIGLSGKMGKQWLESNMAALQAQQQLQGSSPGSNSSGAAGTGSALLDTYLQLIAEHSSNMAAMAAAAAAQQQAGQQPPGGNANEDSPGMMDSPKAGLTGAD